MTKKESNILVVCAWILIIGACAFIYFSPHFERNKPEIIAPEVSFWNLKWDIPIKISDESGIKSYRVILKGEKDKVLLEEKRVNKNEVEFNLPIPKQNIGDGEVLNYKIEARDKSKFFFGNSQSIELNLTIDKVNPEARIIAMSNKITKGGSAVIVFYARDENLGNISLSNGFQSFLAFPFLKEHYYIGIIPWFLHNPSFRGSILIKDKAGNTKKSSIRFARYGRNYRVSNLSLSENFINGKITEIIDNINERALDDFKSPIAMFKYVNETIRNRDEDKIASKILNLNLDNSPLGFEVFKPIKDGTIVGLFGDHRKYVYGKEKIPAGESFHLGVDLARSKNAPIIASNPGVVVMSDELGIYGNTIIIDHGFGVSTIYSHLSDRYVEEGENVSAGDVIGVTGVSGLAFGDHLHFGVLIQGYFALSNEWLDSKWLKTNINDVLAEAAQIIEKR